MIKVNQIDYIFESIMYTKAQVNNDELKHKKIIVTDEEIKKT